MLFNSRSQLIRPSLNLDPWMKETEMIVSVTERRQKWGAACQLQTRVCFVFCIQLYRKGVNFLMVGFVIFIHLEGCTNCMSTWNLRRLIKNRTINRTCKGTVVCPFLRPRCTFPCMEALPKALLTLSESNPSNKT